MLANETTADKLKAGLSKPKLTLTRSTKELLNGLF